MPGAYENAVSVVAASSLTDKPAAAHDLLRQWQASQELGPAPTHIPDMPGRPATPKLVPPADVPRRRLGRIEGRRALLHAVAHIEFNAIDLAADMIGRFGRDPLIPDALRAEFVGDWIKVVDDEARHFGLIRTRLRDLETDYGDYPAHNGLWEAAQSTCHDITARLAIAPMVLEARGLDVTPQMIMKLRSANDHESADILQIIYDDEITHVATGSKWFHTVCDALGVNPEWKFKEMVETHFKGLLKPPFNHPARTEAGVPVGYYA